MVIMVVMVVHVVIVFIVVMVVIVVMVIGHGQNWQRRNWHLNLAFQVTCEGQLSQFLRCYGFAHCRSKKRLSEVLLIAFDILNQFSPRSLEKVQVWFGKEYCIVMWNCLLTYKYKYKTGQRLTILIKGHFLYETNTWTGHRRSNTSWD